MRKIMMALILGVPSVISLHAQEPDSIRQVEMKEVEITGSRRKMRAMQSPLALEEITSDFLRKNFTANLMQSLEQLPGIHSMNIGSGFSKPMIRGMAFNRITVAENGVKQEGQQWGADHGLEIDPFHAEQIVIRKGPASLLYGSDAMGGVIEILPSPTPFEDQVYGEGITFGKTVNGAVGGSLMTGIKKGKWHGKLRYSEQHYGDYRIPADTIVYLTQKLPIYGNKLKNTAGFERNVSLSGDYRNNGYSGRYLISNVYQKNGFFPGAHGIPDASRLEDDGNSRNIDLPYSKVNHLKVTTQQQYSLGTTVWQWDLGYQHNHREEWSLFHTHYGSQPAPEKDPDKEFAFTLQTFSSGMKVRFFPGGSWEHTLAWDLQYQQNRIGGYSFLLPAYKRFTTGLAWVSSYRVHSNLRLNGGIRMDYGKIHTNSFQDIYLAEYLQDKGYNETEVDVWQWRSYEVNRNFGDYSLSFGLVWTPWINNNLKLNAGRSFRLPGANELASNGVHHGTFRHEQGDADLSSEQGWQFDLAYSYEEKDFAITLSPFISWFSNYIYLRPTGEWSILPHAGQIYRYTEAEALFTGAELSATANLPAGFRYQFDGEYIYTRNLDEKIPLPFSPPPSMRNRLTWQHRIGYITGEVHHIAAQNQVSRNEDHTPGATLLNLSIGTEIRLPFTRIEVILSARNLADKKYYNHLSFYRKMEIPEPGRNFQLLIKVPFKSYIK